VGPTEANREFRQSIAGADHRSARRFKLSVFIIGFIVIVILAAAVTGLFLGWRATTDNRKVIQKVLDISEQSKSIASDAKQAAADAKIAATAAKIAAATAADCTATTGTCYQANNAVAQAYVAQVAAANAAALTGQLSKIAQLLKPLGVPQSTIDRVLAGPPKLPVFPSPAASADATPPASITDCPKIDIQLLNAVQVCIPPPP
jgi:cytoskeletal protein RodZ